MAIKNIIQYKASWDINHRFGVIQLRMVGDDYSKHLKIDSADEFLSILDLLRNEKPLFFDDEHIRIQTGPEPIGDGEF